ncbi:hypothetical protein B9N43_01435 [Denitratisoma sp. DHT3]|uniref:cupredoxin domain-containing protein n=1 Tax=Denitratisoma sp. DHT3 TaxID=1981880 RepID=UPI00119861DD|nr:plastocyanin/azurin family copper-binding protein [Denitratisoma sp. DHT3]QDX80032.1 hypothetical protein B9N43_01435 [Denitratisoma sp. DHT3]
MKRFDRLTLLLATGLALTVASGLLSAAEVEVGIVDSRFDPPSVRVVAGDTVRWLNKEKRNNHSVLFHGENLESERMFPGESWSRRFDAPGTYPYSCGPHPEMHGEVVVVPVAAGSEQVKPAQ